VGPSHEVGLEGGSTSLLQSSATASSGTSEFGSGPGRPLGSDSGIGDGDDAIEEVEANVEELLITFRPGSNIERTTTAITS
jgi:hypothetical protein